MYALDINERQFTRKLNIYNLHKVKVYSMKIYWRKNDVERKLSNKFILQYVGSLKFPTIYLHHIKLINELESPSTGFNADNMQNTIYVNTVS